jgi:hypothetical protein
MPYICERDGHVWQDIKDPETGEVIGQSCVFCGEAK